MDSQDVQAKFNAIADLTSNNDIAALLRELGDLMATRFDHTTGVHTDIHAQLHALHADFRELSALVIARLKDNERHHSDKIVTITDKLHSLSNRFMGVESKTDEFLEFVDLKITEILLAVNGIPNERS